MIVYRQLMWKEIREVQWPIAAMCIVALSIPVSYCLFEGAGMAVFACKVACMTYPLLAGTFIGMRLAASERSSRTARFLNAIPVSPQELGVAKLVVSIMAIALPLLLIYAFGHVSAILQSPSSNIGQLASLEAICLASFVVSVHTMLFIAVISSGCASELRAAVVGLSVLGAAWILSGAAISTPPYSLRHFLIPAFLALFPLASREFALVTETPVLATTVSIISILALIIAFVLRYETCLRPLVSSQRIGLVWSRTSVKRPPITSGNWSPTTAVLWKETRRALRICGPIIGVAGLLFLSIVIQSELQRSPRSIVGHLTTYAENIVAPLGFVLAVLLGIGLFVDELSPGVNTFWRSRPIGTSRWYWTKYTVGLCTMLLMVGLPNWRLLSTADGTSLLLVFWGMAYTFCVVATLLVRRAMFAGILGIGATVVAFSVVMVPAMKFVVPYETVGAIGTFLLTVAGAFLGWMAADRDWLVS